MSRAARGAGAGWWLRLAGRHVPAIYGPSGDVHWDEADPTYSIEAADRASVREFLTEALGMKVYQEPTAYVPNRADRRAGRKRRRAQGRGA